MISNGLAEISIRPMKQSDFPDVVDLLHRCDLPLDGLADNQELVFVAVRGRSVVGCAALERYGSNGLLRSVAVDDLFRGQGLGQRLLDTLFFVAQERSISNVFLLTETAADYFGRRGFTIVDRATVPARVQQSIEFRSACPASALAMRRSVSNDDRYHK